MRRLIAILTLSILPHAVSAAPLACDLRALTPAQRGEHAASGQRRIVQANSGANKARSRTLTRNVIVVVFTARVAPVRGVR